MTSVDIIAAFIGAVLSITIVFLTRRDHLAPFVALRWFFIAIIVLFLGFFPGVVDWLGGQLNIGYPPIIPVLIGLSAALIKILIMDIERHKLQIKLDRVVQRLAILEGTLESKNVVKGKFEKKEKQQRI